MIITATGYYQTGSSATYDLLREYDNCHTGKIQNRRYEHTFLYMPNGVFDLEDKLLIGNNIQRSDEALYVFKKEFLRIYENNFGWFGNLKSILGIEILNSCETFVNSLICTGSNGDWAYNIQYTHYSFKALISDAFKIIKGKDLFYEYGKRPHYRKSGAKFSYVEPEEFYTNAKVFLNDYLEMMNNKQEGHLVLDHFLLPHNLFRIPSYFNDDFRVIVVERDPRDVYCGIMNRWKFQNVEPTIPYEIDDYIKFWEGSRRIEKNIDDPRILRLHFEDLVYRYDDTVHKIEEFVGLESNQHTMKNKFFIPEKAKNSTKLFARETQYDEEIQQIEGKLENFLYKFD